MNKYLTKVLVSLFTIVTLFSTLLNSNSANAATNMPDKIKISSNKNVSYVTRRYYGDDKLLAFQNINSYVKVVENGYVYCIEPNRNSLGKEELTLVGELTDPGYYYLAKYGFPNAKPFKEGDDDQNYYVTQVAHWMYAFIVYGLTDGEKIADTLINKEEELLTMYRYSDDPNSTAYKVVHAAYDLYKGAKAAHDKGTINQNVSISATVESNNLTRNGDFLISKPVSVKLTNADTYTVSANGNVTIVDANGNIKNTFNKGENFYVKVNDTNNTNISVTITGNGSIEKVYEYKPNGDYKQHVIYTYIQSTPITKSTNLNFNYESPEIEISKVDATNGKELPGAHLVIKNINNEIVDEWTSTENTHKVKLNPGTYTLTETIQPKGYILSKETVTFTVKEDGTCDKVVMKNKPIEDVLISKVDATNGKELPGAHLVIKNSKGEIVDEWTSTENVHKVKLNPGKYTLTETIQPEGYILSTETITFTVKEDGTSSKVVMKNAPIREIEFSKVDATNGKELPGAHLEIRDSKSNLVDSWISTDEIHKVKLLPGTYTLTETIQPDGYILSTETITFTVKEDGTCDKVVMKNSPIRRTEVEFSKVDASNKEELPGAHLELHDSEGNLIDSWVSTSETHKITLLDGIYTLTETIAPEGYELSQESITFEISEQSIVNKIVMENKPYIEVPITDLNASSTAYLIGSILVLIGFGTIMIYKRKDA